MERYSEKARKFVIELVKDMQERPRWNYVTTHYSSFKKLTNKETTEKAFYQLSVREWMKCRGMSYKSSNTNGMSYGTKKVSKVFGRSNYILYANNGVMGFDTEEELKEFIKNSTLLGTVKLFKDIPIKIETSVKIGG